MRGGDSAVFFGAHASASASLHTGTTGLPSTENKTCALTLYIVVFSRGHSTVPSYSICVSGFQSAVTGVSCISLAINKESSCWPSTTQGMDTGHWTLHEKCHMP